MQIWQNYDEDAEKEAVAQPEENDAALKSEYLDVIVSDVRTKNDLNFSVQVLNTEGTSGAYDCSLGVNSEC